LSRLPNSLLPRRLRWSPPLLKFPSLINLIRCEVKSCR
jgi:hypothetical protein